MSEFSEKDLELAREALLSGDLELPFVLTPDYMYHPESKTSWDLWENERYLEELPKCQAYWKECLEEARKLLSPAEKKKVECYEKMKKK